LSVPSARPTLFFAPESEGKGFFIVTRFLPSNRLLITTSLPYPESRPADIAPGRWPGVQDFWASTLPDPATLGKRCAQRPLGAIGAAEFLDKSRRYCPESSPECPNSDRTSNRKSSRSASPTPPSTSQASPWGRGIRSRPSLRRRSKEGHLRVVLIFGNTSISYL